MAPPNGLDLATARLRAVGSFFAGDVTRTRAVAARLKQQQRTVESVVHGWSMIGSLPSGCRIRIACDAAPPEPGTVLGVLADGKLVVHRIVWRGRRGAARGWIVTQGDSMTLPDAPAEGSAVLGRVTEAEVDGVWRPVPAPRPRRRPYVSAALRFFLIAALELHPSVAVRAAGAMWHLKSLYERLTGESGRRRRFV